MTRRSPLRFSALAVLFAALAPACASPLDIDQGAGGAGSTSTATTTTTGGTGGGAGGTGGTGGGMPDVICALDGNPAAAPWDQTTGPDDAVVTAIAATPQALFVGTRGGLFRSDDDGSTWAPVDGVPTAEITAIASAGADVFAATKKEIFLGENHGASWKPIPAGIPQDQYLGLQVSYLSASGGEVLAIAEYNPYRWDAAAQSWQAIPKSSFDVFDVIESDGVTLYANSGALAGAYYFTGVDWEPVSDLPSWGYHAFAFRGALGFAGNDDDLFRSLDGGLSWSPLAGVTGPVLDLLATPTAIYAATPAGVMTSTDDGDSWSPLPAPATWTSSMSLAHDGADVFWSGARIHRSSDEGANWTEASPLCASDVQSLVAGDGVLYASTAEGLSSQGRAYRSIDGGDTWSELTTLPDPGLVALSPFSLAASGSDVYATQGFLGLARSKNGGLAWKSVPMPADLVNEPVSRVFVVKNILFASSEAWMGGSPSPGSQAPTPLLSAGLYRSSDGGETWQDANEGLPTPQIYQGQKRYPTVVGLREAGGALFLSTDSRGLWRSTDDGASWIAANKGLPPYGALDAPQVRGVVPAGSQLLAAGDTILARSTDGGDTWSPLAGNGLPAGFSIRDVTAYQGHVFVSVGDPEGGVFWSSDRGDTWVRVGTGLDAATSPLRLDGQTLFAGVDGRAVWKLPLPGCKIAE